MTPSGPIDHPRPGDPVATISLPISHTRVCQNAAATWDWFPGHHDPAFAQAQGLPTIYVNTMFLQGLVDRHALEWAGPDAVIRRRTVRMRSPLMAGRTATVHGAVSAVEPDGVVRLESRIESEDGLCATAEITIELSARATAS